MTEKKKSLQNYYTLRYPHLEKKAGRQEHRHRYGVLLPRRIETYSIYSPCYYIPWQNIDSFPMFHTTVPNTF